MTRISLKEAYDNRSVIKQIADLSEIAHDARDSVQSALDSTAAAEAAATAASAQASAAAASASATAADLARYKPQIDGRVDAIQAVVDSVDGRVSAANATAAAAQTSASTAETNAGSAVYTANQATAGVERLTGRIDATDAALAQARADISAAESAIAVNAAGLTSQDARIDAAVVRGAVTAGAADGHLELTTDDGSVRSSAIPIASQIQAGLMNSQTFTDVVSHGIRLSSLEDAANIWYVTFSNPTPTEAQIQAAYEGANPGHPQLVGYKVTDLDKGLTYLWNGSEWQLLSVSSVPKFSQGNFGTIKGASPNSDGAVVAESDGTGSVQGWSAVKGDISTLQSAQSADASDITALKGRMTSAEAQTARVPGIDSRLTAAESGLSSLQTAQQADRTDITALQTSGAETASVAAEAKGASDANATAIATLQDGVQGLQTRTGAAESSVAALQTASSGHGTRIGDLETASSEHGAAIGTLQSSVAGIGVTLESTGTPAAPKLKATVNGHTSEAALPAPPAAPVLAQVRRKIPGDWYMARVGAAGSGVNNPTMYRLDTNAAAHYADYKEETDPLTLTLHKASGFGAICGYGQVYHGEPTPEPVMHIYGIGWSTQNPAPNSIQVDVWWDQLVLQ